MREFLAKDMLPRVKSYIESLRAIVEYQKKVVEADAQSIDDGFKTSLNLQLTLAAIAWRPAPPSPGGSAAASPRRWKKPWPWPRPSQPVT